MCEEVCEEFPGSFGECLVEQLAVVGAAFGRTVIVDAFVRQAGRLLSLGGR
jgi:hypothetical protein